MDEGLYKILSSVLIILFIVIAIDSGIKTTKINKLQVDALNLNYADYNTNSGKFQWKTNRLVIEKSISNNIITLTISNK